MNRYFHKIDYGQHLFESDQKVFTDADITLMAVFLLHGKGLSLDEAVQLLTDRVPVITGKTKAETVKVISRIAIRTYNKPFTDIHSIQIYQEELDDIAKISSAEQRKVLFTLLCFAKYHNAQNPNNNNWVNFNDAMIKRSAGLYRKNSEYNQMLYLLKEAGYITHSKKITKNNMRVDICREEGTLAYTLEDLRGLGAVYAYTWGRFLPSKNGHTAFTSVLKYCKGCGTPFLDGSYRHKRLYCKDCAKR